MTPTDTRRILDHTSAIAGFFLEMADAYISAGDLESGLKCTYMAAWTLKTQNRELTNPRLESNFRRVGSQLSAHGDSKEVNPADDRPQHWLHVLNEALPVGGHTMMAVRWIQNDPGRGKHSVALLSQKDAIPDELVTAVHARGGEVYTPAPQDLLLGKARWLRALACGMASHVVAHVDVDDVIAGAAFAFDGGPRVLFVNHAAHLFWTGAAVADLVLNVRGSQLEHDWTRHYRGTSRSATLPIPLSEPSDLLPPGVERDHQRRLARERLGLPADCVLILTSGSSYKYAFVDSMDFVSVAEDILNSLPNAFLVAVGPEEDERWKSARARTRSRLRALGQQSRAQVTLFHQAADLYIEGFPFGSTTALLEAGIRGVPAVLAPAQCPPPYGTDGVATDEVLERPISIQDYKMKVCELAADPGRRARLGSALSTAVAAHHTGQGWGRYLEDATLKLPAEHSFHSQAAPAHTPENVHHYWTNFARTINPVVDRMLEIAVTHAFSVGIRPRLEHFSTQWKEPGSDSLQARAFSHIADEYYHRGEPEVAREFYDCSLQRGGWNTRVRVKRTLLSLGGAGAALRSLKRFVS